MKGKYDALTVARYIINYSYDNNYSCSNLKLQKLLYFVQGFFLVDDNFGFPCFNDTIEAWKFGPVVPSVYHEYKMFGCGDIPYVDTYYDSCCDNDDSEEQICKFNADVIDQDYKKLINKVIDDLKDCSASSLVHITHEQSPWKCSYVENENNPIGLDLIKNFFNYYAKSKK